MRSWPQSLWVSLPRGCFPARKQVWLPGPPWAGISLFTGGSCVTALVSPAVPGSGIWEIQTFPVEIPLCLS